MTTHGATSIDRIRPRAANHFYCRSMAKVELLDAFFEERGLLDEKGNPRSATKIYWVAVNSATRTLARLEEHVRTSTRPPGSALAAYLEATYVEDDGDDD